MGIEDTPQRLPVFEKFDPETQKWSTWTKRLENYFDLQGVTNANLKKSAILSFCGGPAYTLLEEKVCPEKSPNDLSYTEIVSTLQSAYEPDRNLWSVRFEFRNVSQNSNDTLGDFECRLRKAAVDCKWSGDNLQMNLIEQFLKGMADSTLREAILVKCDSSKFTKLDEVTKEAQALFSIRTQPSTSVAKINYQQKFRKPAPKKTRPRNPDGNQNSTAGSSATSEKIACYRCGSSSHLANTCRHKSSKCSACNRTGHLRSVCRAPQQKVNLLREETFYSIGGGRSKPPLRIRVSIENHDLPMEVDTGSAVATVSMTVFRQFGSRKQLRRNDIRLCPPSGEVIDPAGYAEVNVSYAGETKNLRLYVIDREEFPSLVGRDWLSALPIKWSDLFGSGDWNLNGSNLNATERVHRMEEKDFEAAAKDLLEKYPNLSKEGIGCIPSTEAKLELTSQNPSPTYVRARPLAHAIIDITNKELDYLLENKVIQKLNTSDWAHPMVVVPRAKGKKVRICGDFKNGINRFINIDEHPLKNIRHALDNIGNGLRFSKLDISSAFLHMPVRESDRKYLVINTHRGLFQFNRMTNGLCNAPAIWQRYIENLLADIAGTEVVIDDIIVTGSSSQEHLERLEQVFSRLNDQNIRLNIEKCEFFKEAVTYCGFVLKHQQIYKCDDKIRAIKNAPSPTNLSELRAFLGLIQFYSCFAHRLADLANPMYKLLKQNVKFDWTEEMQKSFNGVKQELCSDRVIVPFDPAKPLLLATDASPTGISAILSHRFADGSERPIAYFSRALSETERKYTQIDKEALGIKTGVERFFYYLFGRRFVLITDSRPLVQIFAPQKSLPPLSATRMQHYAIYLLGFTFDIVYRQTEKHQNVDALSRLPISSDEFKGEDGLDSFMINQLEDAPINVNVISQQTQNCKELRPLLKALKKGSNGSTSPRFFGLDLSEFSLLRGSIILRGHRVLVPKEARAKILSELHEGHFGEKKMKQLARRHVWWPGIDRDINHAVKSCNACLTFARNPPKETLHPWHPCSAAWERVHMDFAGPIEGKYILVIVDAFSKWVEAFITSGKTTKETLQYVRETIARFGLPKVIVTDNDPTFVAMQDFCNDNNIRLMHSPPYHPASNGQAERFVGVMKSALKKLSVEGGDLRSNLSRFLFRQRMVESSTGETPAARMIGRELRSRLDLLQEVPEKHEFDAANPKFEVGQPVMVRDYRQRHAPWIAGRVRTQRGTRICQVEVPDGSWNRHYEQMRSRAETVSPVIGRDNSILFAALAGSRQSSDPAPVEV